ncbi:MAG: ABC transporter permease subunit [Thermoflexales bacterium]|nr:ABC transporter permease subunit [Thermoflexales bacterium]
MQTEPMTTALPLARARLHTAKAPADPMMSIGRSFTLFAVILCLAPIPLAIAVATTANWPLGFWAEGFTLRWLSEGWQAVQPYALFSLLTALIVLAVDLAIGLPASWVIARHSFPGRQVLTALINVPLAVPGIAIALSLILAYPLARPSGLLLVVGQVVYTLPFLVATLAPALAQPDLIEREAVAQTLGASAIQRFFFVTLPSIRSAMLAALILVFTLSMGEFNVSFFLFTPLNKTLPVELYSAYITGRVEVAAAITLIFLAFVVPAAIAIERLGGSKIGQA